MRKRNIQIIIRLNAKEKEFLSKQVKRSGLPQETYLRSLISGYMPKELPPLDYHYMIRELHAIGANLNQIAARANATGHIDRAVFEYEANRLRKAVLDIHGSFVPESRKDDQPLLRNGLA